MMGGSFDPVHVGHVGLGAMACREVEKRGTAPAGLVLVPAARSPFKRDQPAASDAERVHMLRLATRGLPNTVVWTDELDRAAPGEPSYTIDTLRRARQWLDAHGNAGAELRLLIGADQAGAFHRWREATDILRLASPLVVGRDGLDLTRELAGKWDEASARVWRAGELSLPEVGVSSTLIREAIAAGDTARARAWLHPAVLEYIRERGLYRR